MTHFDVAAHEGWTPAEEGKIDRYVNQLSLLPGDDRTPLEAPRMRGWYRYRCWAKGCNGPRQGVLDWEFVALQRQASLRSA
ncbi:hypothetical protein ACOARS_13695, partial [Glaesserella parasuis]|uniref:hypothetical protein n=1 Tax=Glaesserella parasuis TaxID=738 RepID=UPI003B827A65